MPGLHKYRPRPRAPIAATLARALPEAAATTPVPRRGRRGRARPLPTRLKLICAGALLAALVALPLRLLSPAPRLPASHGAIGGAAPGWPGRPGYWVTGRKMGVGTALARPSKVWFTITDGVLSEVYYPTLDTPDLNSLQFVVVTGRAAAQREDTAATHTIRLPDPHALAYRVTNTARDGSYRIVTDYCSDPARPVVLLHARFVALRPAAARDTVYVLLRPNADGTSLHNTLTVQQNVGGTGTTLADTRGPVSLALAARPALGAASAGYHLAASDPWLELRQAGHLVHHYAAANDGTVVGAAATALRPGHDLTLALGFGPRPVGAMAAARAALAAPFGVRLASYIKGWRGYAATLRAPGALLPAPLRDQYYTSALALKASEDKAYSGALVASPTIPFGDARVAGDAFVPGYHLVWARDLYEIATALLAAGDTATPRAALAYLFARQQRPDGGLPRNTRVDGRAPLAGVQLDQTAYPVILAWQLGVVDATTYRRHILPAADYLIRAGPATGQDRWEEARGYSPSTIAAEAAALACAADIARRRGDGTDATLFGAVADDLASHVAAWTATRTGHLAPTPYYMRIDDNTNPDDGDRLTLANGGSADERDVVDAGFLELVRLGLAPPGDRLVRDSLAVVDRVLRVRIRRGPAWYRYNGDGYGETTAGSPFTSGGAGRPWPLLDGERGEYELAAGHRGAALAWIIHEGRTRRRGGPRGADRGDCWRGADGRAWPTRGRDRRP